VVRTQSSKAALTKAPHQAGAGEGQRVTGPCGNPHKVVFLSAFEESGVGLLDTNLSQA